MSYFTFFFRYGSVLTVLSFLCVSFLVSKVCADDRKILWQSREQFVAIEPLEKNSEGENTHPVDVTAENLTIMLASIAVKSEENNAVEALFTQESLQTTVPYLQQALRSSGSGDDVTFAVIGLYKSLYGLAKRPKVTTGRIFFRGTTLNIIIGQAQQEVNDRVDRRLEPFIPGSRQKIAAGDWKIVPRDGSDLFKIKRKDWVVFNDALRKTAPAPPAAKPISAHVPASALEPSHQSSAEGKNPVERLKVLNELKNNGLITDEEYRDKRQQIMNSL